MSRTGAEGRSAGGGSEVEVKIRSDGYRSHDPSGGQVDFDICVLFSFVLSIAIFLYVPGATLSRWV